MLSNFEKRILQKIADSQLITKAELGTYLKTDGFKGRETSDINKLIESASRALSEKELISAISPVGSTCFIITQKGIRFLNER